MRSSSKETQTKNKRNRCRNRKRKIRPHSIQNSRSKYVHRREPARPRLLENGKGRAKVCELKRNDEEVRGKYVGSNDGGNATYVSQHDRCPKRVSKSCEVQNDCKAQNVSEEYDLWACGRLRCVHFSFCCTSN